MGLALGAIAAGFAGAEAGLVWVVVGVWTVRWAWGRPLGVAWGVAIVGVGLRWRAMGLEEVLTATRLVGPTIAAEPVLASAGAGVALVAALVEESSAGDLTARSSAERIAAVAAVLALVWTYAVPGSRTVAGLGWFLGAAALATFLVVLGAPFARRVPSSLLVASSAAGAAAMGVVR